jgi:hypothetical protein
MTDSSADRATRIATGLAILVAPAMQMVGFFLHPQFWTLAKETDAAGQLGYIQNYANWTTGHVLVTYSLPVVLLVLVQLGKILSEYRPWWGRLGSALGAIGVVFMGGIFGMSLSLGAVGTLPADEGTMRALQAVMDMKGPLVFLAPASLMLIGGIVLGTGLFFTPAMPKWSSALYTLGQLVTLVWLDIDAYMFVGAFFSLVGLAPVALRLLSGSGQVSRAVNAALIAA